MNRYEKINRSKETFRGNVPEPKPSWPPKVRRAVVFIIAHLFDPRLTVGWMKEECRINGKGFAAGFALCTGYKPKSYILYQRIELSKLLLKRTEVTVTTVAVTVGFNTLSAFDKAFKHSTGLRPVVWRKQAGVS